MNFTFTGEKNIARSTEGSVLKRLVASKFYCTQSHTELLDYSQKREDIPVRESIVTRKTSRLWKRSIGGTEPTDLPSAVYELSVAFHSILKRLRRRLK